MDPEFLKRLGLSIARGVPQMATGFVDLAALPFTLTGLLDEKDVVGGTEYLTQRGLLPPPQEGIIPETLEMLSGALSPQGAATGGLLALGTMIGKRGAKSVNQAIKTAQDEAMEVAQRNASLPIEQGGLGLPKDNTAMDRAKAMGTDYPGFHATGSDIKYIDPDIVAQSDYGTIGQGFYIDPSENAAYSNLISRINQSKSPQNIMPVMFNPENLYDMTGLIGPRSAEQSKQLTENLKNLGYKGTFTKMPDGAINEVAIFDPSIVRSRFAAFDPMKRNLPDILAGVGATGVGLGLLSPMEEEEQF